MFEWILLRGALNDEPINGKSTKEKAEEFMDRVGKARDATMLREGSPNWNTPMYWWNAGIVATPQTSLRARRRTKRAKIIQITIKSRQSLRRYDVHIPKPSRAVRIKTV